MFSSQSHRRNALVAVPLMFVAVVLASVSAARANITYNIVDYPANETDSFNGETDTVSGTIVTDGNLGSIGGSDFVSMTFTISNPGVPQYNPATGQYYTVASTASETFTSFNSTNSYESTVAVGAIEATDTTLSLPQGSVFFSEQPYGVPVTFEYVNHGNDQGQYAAWYTVYARTLYGFGYESGFGLLCPPLQGP